MNLARAYERRVTPVATKGKSSGSASPLITGGQKTGTGMTVLKSANTNKPRFKRLTTEELAAKRANGECYRCTEKYSADHQCSSKGVFLLELDDGVEEVEAIEELGTSLHALTGIDVANTMKLRVKIHGTELLALVDTGSSHTFIRDSVAHQLGLQMTPWPVGKGGKWGSCDLSGCLYNTSCVCPRRTIQVNLLRPAVGWI
jgi:hypothetical protein